MNWGASPTSCPLHEQYLLLVFRGSRFVGENHYPIMDNLYTLLRSVDNSRTPPLSPEEAGELCKKKKTYLLEETKTNPLAQAILQGDKIGCDSLPKPTAQSFLCGPATFFRVHELLRKTRAKNLPIQIGSREFSHNDAVDLYERCVPNVQLHHAPWCSLSRYSTSLGLAWGITVLVAHIVARGRDNATMLDGAVLYHLGVCTTFAAFLFTALKRNRDVRHPAPWNTAIYLDLNTDLLRRDLPLAALARKEFLPHQDLFKTPAFYYALARKIESHGFDADCTAQISGHKNVAPG